MGRKTYISDMFWLLPLLAVCCFSVGSYAVRTVEKCYGRHFNLPTDKVDPVAIDKLFFTPTNPRGPKKLVMEKRQVKDPRYTVSYSSVSLHDVTERDEGIFSISHEYLSKEYEVIRLKVVDCSDKEFRNFGDTYKFRIPKDTEFVEFTPNSLDQPIMLWNRTNPNTQEGRATVDGSLWKFDYVTQADNGYYNIRRKDNYLLARHKLTVSENTEYYYEKLVDEELSISFSLEADFSTVTFTPSLAMEGRRFEVIKDGRRSVDASVFGQRLHMQSTTMLHFTIEPLKVSDSGTFEVRDHNWNLALLVQLEVTDPALPQWAQYAIGGGAAFLALVFCCCCCRSCICKESSSKRSTTAVTAVHYHDDASQPSGPRFSTPPYVPAYTHDPTRITAREPESRSLVPPVPASGGPSATPSFSLGSDCLFSNPEPQFKLGSDCLSSDSTRCDVYTSDKLNFL